VKARKQRESESEKARSFMGIRRFFSGGQPRHFVYHFQKAEDQCSL